MDYVPHGWALLKVCFSETTGHPDQLRVLAGWRGGYLGSDNWKINSGITKIIDQGDSYVFEGASGSRYICGKASYHIYTIMLAGLDTFQRHPGVASCEVLEEGALTPDLLSQFGLEIIPAGPPIDDRADDLKDL